MQWLEMCRADRKARKEEKSVQLSRSEIMNLYGIANTAKTANGNLYVCGGSVKTGIPFNAKRHIARKGVVVKPEARVSNPKMEPISVEVYKAIALKQMRDAWKRGELDF